MSFPSNVVPISAAAAGARETARARDGKFGAQERAESDLDLMVGSPEFSDLANDDARTREILGIVDDYLTGDADLPARQEALAAQLPAIAEDVNFHQSFGEQYVDPMVDAGARGDVEEARAWARKLIELDNAEQAYLDQDWRPAGVTVTDRDNMYGARHTGELYDTTRPLTETAKLMRADIKAAQQAGYIPDDLDYRVVKDGNSLRIIVSGMADEDSLWRDPHLRYGTRGARSSWAATRLDQRLSAMGNAYARQQSNAQVDYSNVSHYVFVEVRRESEQLFWAHDAAEKKLAAEARKVPEGDPRRAELNAQAKEMLATHQAERAAKREFDREAWGW